MKEIQIGTKAQVCLEVTREKLACSVGSGSLEVFATPVMAALMEKAACKAIEEAMEGDETTVGTSLDINHTSPTPAGMKVTVLAEVTNVKGREISFKVSARDESGEIGFGTHKRFVVFGEKFVSRAMAKGSKADGESK